MLVQSYPLWAVEDDGTDVLIVIGWTYQWRPGPEGKEDEGDSRLVPILVQPGLSAEPWEPEKAVAIFDRREDAMVLAAENLRELIDALPDPDATSSS